MTEPFVPKPLVKFETFKIKDITIDPTNIISLDIYESIEFPGITGQVILQDYSAIKEVENIFAGDSFQISFSREKDPPLVLDMVISESYGDNPMEDKFHNAIMFKFCSPWMVEAFTKKRSRPFVNSDGTGMLISEIVQILVKECGGQIGWFVDTKQRLERFVSPYWSPIDTIRYLMGFAMDENNNGGYLLWTDAASGAVNFAPIGRLISEIEELNYGVVPFGLRMNTPNQYTAERIIAQEISQGFNIIKYADMGMGRSRFVGFNYDKTEVMSVDKRVDEYGHNHISKKLSLNTKFLSHVYRTTKNSYLFDNTNELIRDGDTNDPLSAALLNGKLSSKLSLMFSDMLKITAVTNGESFEKRAGKLINVAYPSIMGAEGAENKQFTGTFLIKDIRHTIQGMEYANSLLLIADGYKIIERDDMISWGEINTIEAEFTGDDFDRDV